jgi:hypothetical protein
MRIFALNINPETFIKTEVKRKNENSQNPNMKYKLGTIPSNGKLGLFAESLDDVQGLLLGTLVDVHGHVTLTHRLLDRHNR